jgi:Zn-dependent protease
VIPSLSVHEYAHAWASTRLGDVTPRLHGRLTLNPLAHIDMVGTIVIPLFLSLMGAGVIGRAKPVPINPHAYHKPIQGEFFVAMA